MIDREAELEQAVRGLIGLLEHANRYLDHPDVQAMHFAQSSTNAAEAIRAGIRTAQKTLKAPVLH